MARDSKRISMPAELHTQLAALALKLNGGTSINHLLSDVVAVADALANAQSIEVIFPHKTGVPIKIVCGAGTEEQTPAGLHVETVDA
jgi:hypothetical protein